ncbi:M14 metallopeptidase family protein [uncultured Microbulbifer sp.]|uniref:M14 family metallopeptidase n=1 Tax=uncultured Microbulbifer sp. TaxID=348147 RepID=UPI0025E2C769|nr:M14 metallopeptidase family protein [uncultured Microbulbifer sp.]
MLCIPLALGGALVSAGEKETVSLDYQVPGLDKPAIRQADILPLVEGLRTSPLLKVEQVGESFEGRPLFSIAMGRGDTRVMMWSQMHGDEPTATSALFDLIAYMTAPEQEAWRDRWMDELTLVMVPMLNPDGAERNTRHNAQSFDINRDAKALQSPEGRVLMDLARSFKPHFGFNLHDQNRHYGVGNTGKMATISVLAPPYNEAREVNASRARAMQLIGALVKRVEPFIGGHVGRYDDAYSWRAFGDTFSEMGISTILIESGAHPNDPNRQVARRINVEMLVTAIDSIAGRTYVSVSSDIYGAIPFNEDDAIVDVKVGNVRVGQGNAAYRIDLAINEKYGQVAVVDLGDLSLLHGAQELDASAAQYRAPRAYELKPGQALELTDSRYLELLRQGYGYFTGDESLLVRETALPVVINPRNPLGEIPARRRSATFLLEDEEGAWLAVIDGALVDLRAGGKLLASVR